VRKILLIDDDEDDAEVFKEAIKEIDPGAVLYWYSGCETKNFIIEKKIPFPDIVFLDINMPALSGWDCLKIFRETEEYKSVPIIMYTTSSRSREIELAKELGATDFVTKPSDYQLLISTLQNILGNE
jgi:CheY-like chemotaxis protein